MTSTPVAASARAYLAGTQAAVNTSTKKDVDNSFSDIFKSQTGNGETGGTEDSSAVKTEKDSLTEACERTNRGLKTTVKKEEVSPEEAIKDAERAAEGAAVQMVTETAEVLGISEEEVKQLLDELDMTPMDLLNTENLQALLLYAAGEADNSSFMLNETLFSNLKDLTASLEEIVETVADATGLDAQEVSAIFEELMQQTDVTEADLAQTEAVPDETGLADENVLKNQMPVEAQVIQVTEKMPEDVKSAEDSRTEVKNAGEVNADVQGEEAVSETDAEIMLERSMKEQERGNDSQNSLNSNAEQNPFAQNLNNLNAMEAEAAVSSVEGYFDADTEMIMRQITDYMKGQITDGVSELEMQLHPESLGNLHVKLTSKEGLVTAQFTAQNDVVKAALESNMIQLKETFKEQGITVAAIEVTVGSERFAQQFGGSSRQTNGNNEQAERPRVRRINLNDLEAFEEEEISEEERLAKEMLQSSGNTVDYTA